MTPERWIQIEELFHRACECDSKDRDALLDVHVAVTPNYGEKFKRCWRVKKTPGTICTPLCANNSQLWGSPLPVKLFLITGLSMDFPVAAWVWCTGRKTSSWGGG